LLSAQNRGIAPKVFFLVALAALLVLGSAPAAAGSAAQAPTPQQATETIAPETSTSQPISNPVAAEANQAQSETQVLGDEGDGSDVPVGVIAGAAAAAVVILAGVAYRVVRGSTGTG
jgi:hypothetical protein